MSRGAEVGLITKLKLMRAGRISSSDYKHLLACGSALEIVNFLKRKQGYSQVLSGLNSNFFDIASFKSTLKALMMSDFETIMRYDLAISGDFHKYIITRIEIRRIIDAVLSVKSKNFSDVVHNVTPFLCSKSNLNFGKLAVSRTYAEILEAVSNTKYYKILQKFIQKNTDEEFNFAGIEVSLQNFLYELCFEIAEKSKQPEFVSYFKDYIDLKNLVMIYRMKKFYDLNDKFMISYLLDGGNISQKKFLEFLKYDVNVIIDKFREEPIGKKWFKENLNFIDNIPNQMRFNWCRHQISHSNKAITLAFSFVILDEIEMSNILCIVHGLESNFSVDEISKNIIGI